MLNLDAARVVAERYLDPIRQSGLDVVIDEQSTLELSFGWVFFWNGRAFLEADDRDSMLVGNAPLIVDRATGELHETGTAHPIEHYIREYEARRQVS